jgi:hypothetical protein
MDWTVEGYKFESQQEQNFSSFHVVQTGSWTQSAFYPIGTVGYAAGE